MRVLQTGACYSYPLINDRYILIYRLRSKTAQISSFIAINSSCSYRGFFRININITDAGIFPLRPRIYIINCYRNIINRYWLHNLLLSKFPLLTRRYWIYKILPLVNQIIHLSYNSTSMIRSRFFNYYRGEGLDCSG